MAQIPQIEREIETLRERIATSESDKHTTLAAFDAVTMLLVEVLKELSSLRFAIDMKD